MELLLIKKWQKKWEETELYKFNPNKEGEKLYVLEMSSYPSGSQLHAGHWFNYGPVDSWARLKKMQGYNVFQPMGFDAFGLPAENLLLKQEFIHGIYRKKYQDYGRSIKSYGSYV